MVETKQEEQEEEEEEEDEEDEEEDNQSRRRRTTLIKSNNPHLAGGEKCGKWRHFFPVCELEALAHLVRWTQMVISIALWNYQRLPKSICW